MIVLQIVKAAVLAVMMFFSLHYLGFGVWGAMIFSLVPLLLGLLNVFTGFAYGLTGFIFILACATALVPDWRTKSQGFLNWALQEKAKHEKLVAPEPKQEPKQEPKPKPKSDPKNQDKAKPRE